MCNTITGFDVDLSEVVDPHTVAGLLKLHFREQRFSMIPRGQPLSNITRAVKDKDVGHFDQSLCNPVVSFHEMCCVGRVGT